ncbi:MAG: hypothetical protein V4515_04270 [Chloroflexota bacterium]
MINHRGRSSASILGLALIALIALPATAFANTSGPIAQTGGMSATIPLLGASLTVDVVLDPVGNISSVALDPVGDFSATKVGPHAVAFETTDGTTQVKIKAKGDKLSLKVAAGSLAALVGSGTWTADVFGTGATTLVGYTIGDSAGAPTISVDSVAAPAGITVTQSPPETSTSDDGAKASVRVDFAADGFVKRLKLSVSVKFEDGDQQARLKIELSGKDKQNLTGTLASLVGPHAWSGLACDGTTALGIAFTVVDTAGVGSVTFDPATFATGGTATATANENGFTARFDGTRTKVKVRLTQADDGTWSLKVSAKTDKCKDQPAVDPTVNTPVAPRDAEKAKEHDGNQDGSGKGDSKEGDH